MAYLIGQSDVCLWPAADPVSDLAFLAFCVVGLVVVVVVVRGGCCVTVHHVVFSLVPVLTFSILHFSEHPISFAQGASALIFLPAAPDVILNSPVIAG